MAAGDVMFIRLVIWLCNGEGAKLVLVAPFFATEELLQRLYFDISKIF